MTRSFDLALARRSKGFRGAARLGIAGRMTRYQVTLDDDCTLALLDSVLEHRLDLRFLAETSRFVKVVGFLDDSLAFDVLQSCHVVADSILWQQKLGQLDSYSLVSPTTYLLQRQCYIEVCTDA